MINEKASLIIEGKESGILKVVDGQITMHFVNTKNPEKAFSATLSVWSVGMAIHQYLNEGGLEKATAEVVTRYFKEKQCPCTHHKECNNDCQQK